MDMAAFAITETESIVHGGRWRGGSHVDRIPNDKKPFIAWDGEGYTDTTGVHHYNLFGNSAGRYLSGDSLNMEECFELLLSTADDFDAIHVIFSGVYDLVMMIHKRNLKECQRIMGGKPVWLGQIRVQYFRSKWLSLKHRDGRRIILYDVFSFFGKSFVKACQEYLGDDETLQEIANTKTQRSTFQREDLETKVIPYWKLELEYLVKLCESLRAKLLQANIKVTRWHGPGAVATTVLRKNHIKQHLGSPPDEMTELARHGYYGGRFEQFMLGHFDRPVYQYDINSAYPAAIAQLPSLEGARWFKGSHRMGESFHPYGMYQIRFKARGGSRYGTYPLPWRSDKGRIYFPQLVGAPSWYWGVECNNLLLYPTDYDVIECWLPIFSEVRPFQFVEEMFAERLIMKAHGDPAQLAVKLALNSLYGKLAQSKGAVKRKGVWTIPSYHQLIWAGWITAYTRAKLFEAMTMGPPNSVIAVETDAVFTRCKLDLPISNKLGEWSEQVYEGITFIQSGVYFYRINGEWQTKSRGFEGGNQVHQEWLDLLARSTHGSSEISFEINRFGSVPGLSNWAKWYSYKRSTNYEPITSKRVHFDRICPACQQGLNMAQILHPLAVPQMAISSGNISSSPHPLPWAEDDFKAWGAVYDPEDIDTFAKIGF
jgi:hypothetical protein